MRITSSLQEIKNLSDKVISPSASGDATPTTPNHNYNPANTNNNTSNTFIATHISTGNISPPQSQSQSQSQTQSQPQSQSQTSGSTPLSRSNSSSNSSTSTSPVSANNKDSNLNLSPSSSSSNYPVIATGPSITELESYLEYELRRGPETAGNEFPKSLVTLKGDIEKTPKWMFERLKKEYKLARDAKIEADNAKSTLSAERDLVQQWKEKTQKSVTEVMIKKEDDLRAKDLELNRLRSTLSKTNSALNSNNIASMSMPNLNQYQRVTPTLSSNTFDREDEVEQLKREKMELVQKYNNSISNLEAYTSEVDTWKLTVTKAFTKRLEARDNELKELKETIELLMRKDEGVKDQDDLMNSLLEFINNNESNKNGNNNNSGLTNSMSSSNLNNSGTLNTSGETNLSKSNYRDNEKSSTWLSVTPNKESLGSIGKSVGKSMKSDVNSNNNTRRLFKVLLPSNEGFVTIEYSDSMTLASVMEIVCSKRALGNPENYAFQHINAPAQSPFLKLSYTLGNLSVTSIRLIRKLNNNNITLTTSSSEDLSLAIPNSDPGIGMPYLVFHAEHKTVEDLINMMDKHLDEEKQDVVLDGLVSPCKGFDIELGSKKAPALKNSSTKRLVDQDRNTPYYQHYFFNKPHYNYYGESSSRIGPVIISMELPLTNVVDSETKLRALVRTKFDDEWVFVPNTKSVNIKRALLKAIESQCRNGEKLSGIKLQKISHVDGPKEIANLEQKLMVKGYKFGVLYCRPGQTNEDDMFGNVQTSHGYDEFLEFLGDKVALKGWANYRGGLDIKNDSTGTHSIYTKHCGFEVMFHVSTLLPYYEKDVQQLERKRHLGNDVGVIIFKDSDEPFAPDTIKSEFNHVFAVITKVNAAAKNETAKYKVSFAYKGGVGISQPLLTYPAVFEKSDSFRDFLLTKMINSERCAMYAPSFITKISKTKELQMQALIDNFKNAFRN